MKNLRIEELNSLEKKREEGARTLTAIYFDAIPSRSPFHLTARKEVVHLAWIIQHWCRHIVAVRLPRGE